MNVRVVFRRVTMPEKTKVLADYRKQIEQEVPFVGLKPYSHNIISCCLSIIASKYGNTAANKAIDDFALEELGWSKHE